MPDVRQISDAEVARFSTTRHPLVTTGGGALPLPTKQPAKLSEATTRASAKATFFISSLPLIFERRVIRPFRKALS